MNLQKDKIIGLIAEISSALFSSPVVTIVCTIALIPQIKYIGLIISTIFFYIILPVLAYLFLKKKGLITDKKYDFNIRKREERTPYNIIITTGFLTNYLLLRIYNIPIAQDIALLLFLAFLLFGIVTLFWKISGHMTQTVLAITTLAYISDSYSIYFLLIGYLVCVPIVAWSRIYMKHHTLAQVIAGTVLTSILAFLVYTIL